MKKVLLSLSITVLSALALGTSTNVAKPLDAAWVVSYLPFTTSNFTAYDTDGNAIEGFDGVGTIAESNATYWDGESFNALDSFFRGETNESWTGTIKSVSWEQSTRYVMFMWGGRAEMTINFYNASDDSLIGSMTNDLSNGNPLMVNYYTIPDTIDDSTLESGVNMYLELVDNYTADYGFNNFGYLSPNATLQTISEAMWEQMDNFDYSREENRFRAHYTMEHYNGNAKFNGIRELAARTNVDEDFESNETFLNNWFLDPNYTLDDIAEGQEDNHVRHNDTIISNITHRVGTSNMPINKTGEGFFKGYYEDGTGYTATDNARYRFVSRPFILSGTGLVSLKMAGRTASLHVLRGVSRNSNDENEIEYDLAWANLKTFSSSGDEENMAGTNFNTVSLVRHYFNLEAFKGEIIQLAIADTDTGGDWGSVNFDELITYYEDYPTFKVETGTQKDTYHPYFLDKYVSGDSSDANTGIDYREENKEATEDTTVMKEAATFMASYYALVRNQENGLTHCAKSLDLTSLTEAYNNLSTDAKTLVTNSEDFDYGKSATSSDWYTFTMNEVKMSDSINALFNSGNSNLNLVTSNNENPTTVIVLISVGSLILLGLVLLIIKKKALRKN